MYILLSLYNVFVAYCYLPLSFSLSKISFEFANGDVMQDVEKKIKTYPTAFTK